MDFSLRETDQRLVERVRNFAASELAEGALRRVHDDEYPRDIARRLAAEGFLGLTIPVADGGQGGTLLQAVLTIEAISMVCPKSADVVQVGNFGPIRLLSAFGSAAQKRRFLDPLLKGEIIFTVAMTEPDAGSAVTDLQTAAVPDGDGVRVSGEKIYTTHGREADVFLTYVRYGPGVDGIGSVLIERDDPGVSYSEPERFLSGERWVRMRLDDVRVPADRVFLREGGFRKQIDGFNVERLGNAARSLGLGRCSLALAREHALNRRQFGRPLCEFQGLQWGFAEQEVALQAAQLLLYRAAANADLGFPSATETAIAKIQCNVAGFAAADFAMQVMGAAGYSESSLVEFCFRRTRGWQIAGGSLEMMKNRVAEAIFDRRFSQRPARSARSATS